MASSNDGSSKGPAKPSTDGASKKPSALIDLKATEVDIRDPKKEAAKAAGSMSAGAISPAAKASGPTASATGATPASGSTAGSVGAAASGSMASAVAAAAAAAGESAGSASAGNPANTKAAASAPSSGSDSGAGKPTAAAATGSTSPPQRVPASSGGLKGAATHLAAGLAGGLLALLGADRLMPKGPGAQGAETAALKSLETRLTNVELVSARQMAPELAQRLAAFDQKLAGIERLAGQVDQQQAKLAGETKDVSERLAAQAALSAPTPGGAEAERVAKLEETLKILSEAAAGDPQRGRIPQLATITGKLVDLEASLATQLNALRKSVTQEVDSRLAQSSDAAQAARTGTQRLDRELAGVKTEAAQITQRVDGLKDQAERAEVTIRGLREEATTLKADVGSIRESVSRELQTVARPTDVTSAVSPLTSKLAALEQNVQGVVRGEDDRRANVERIVVALELGNLKRTVERGAPFGNELAEVRRIAGTKIDLTALDRFKDKGVASLGDLEREFRTLAFQVIEADGQVQDAHWSDRLIASAKSIVRVRKVDQTADDKSVDATVARMEQGLKAGKLADVTSEAGKLSVKAKAPITAWLDKVGARAAVDGAIGAIEQELKASLGAQSQSGKKG